MTLIHSQVNFANLANFGKSTNNNVSLTKYHLTLTQRCRYKACSVSQWSCMNAVSKEVPKMFTKMAALATIYVTAKLKMFINTASVHI